MTVPLWAFAISATFTPTASAGSVSEQTFSTDLLDSINEILSILGRAPVFTLNTPNPEVALARQILQRVDREVQEAGWHWNTDLEVTLEPDLTGRFPVPVTWIRAQPQRGRYPGKDIFARNGFFYDRKNNTEVLGLSTLIVDKAVLYLTWDALPQAARRYCELRAGRLMHDRLYGDSGARHRQLMADELLARRQLEQYSAQLGEANWLNTSQGRRIISRGRRPVGRSFLPVRDV